MFHIFTVIFIINLFFLSFQIAMQDKLDETILVSKLEIRKKSAIEQSRNFPRKRIRSVY